MIEDAEIIERCRQGQLGLMDILVDRYKIDLYTLCMRLARSKPDADDLFQDTWMRVMKRLDRYSPEHTFRTWLFAICTNRYRDLYRWRRRWTFRGGGRGGGAPGSESLASIVTPAPNPEEAALAEETRAEMSRAIDALEDLFKLPVVLFYFHNCTIAEIGEVLGIPAGTVKSRLHKGRERLKQAMEGAGYER